jgi:hypothetical protein
MMSTFAQTPSGYRRWINPLSMLTVAVIAILLYGRALNFAFFNDDPSGHFAWMESRTFLDFFGSSEEYGYYRPVVFATLKSLVTLGGTYAPLFHALLLLLNGANVAMLWLLAHRISASRLYAWAAALIFATFPFSYEAVAYVASLTHPLLLFWLLLTLLLYQQARRLSVDVFQTRSTVYHVAAFITFLLGLLTHENGLFIPLALVGIEWLDRPPRGLLEEIKRPFLAYFGAAALYLLLWVFIPKNSQQGLASLSTLANNLYPFLQSVVYPLLPLAQLSADDVARLLAMSLVSILLLFLVASLVRARSIWLFALLWTGLSALPSILFLSSDYLYGSPRLHYLPAVGIALLWALPVLAAARLAGQKSRPRALATILALLYTLAIILPPLSFIRCELDFYEEAGEIVLQMRDLARAVPLDQDLLFVNVPFFFSSYDAHPNGCENPYPWTPVGAVVLPPYAKARDFIRFNGGPDRAVTAVFVPEYKPGWNAFGQPLTLLELRQRLGQTAVFVYDLAGGDFFNLSAAWLPNATPVTPVQATFGQRLALLDSAVTQPMDQNEIHVILRWQVQTPDSALSTVFVHLYDASGNLVTQHDGPPAMNFVPPSLWQEGDIIHDIHIIPLDAPLPAGTYRLAAGLYDPASGERLSATANQSPLPDNVFTFQQLTIP